MDDKQPPAPEGGTLTRVDDQSSEESEEEAIVVVETNGDVSPEDLNKPQGDLYGGWEKIGFHRIIAGFFYNYFPIILGAGLMIVGTGVIIPMILPFPDAKGYRSIAGSLYALMFLLFDAGIGSAIGKFVPEYRIKDPKRSLEYVSFFVWFQMITGLMQITAIAIYVLNWIPSDMAHLSWIFLVYSTIQYPGMLGVLKSVLQSYQHFGKYVLSAFIGQLSEVVTQVIFILLGRWWGAQNPAIGELMGMSIGLVIGLYVDDFIAFAVSAKLLDGVLRDMGFRVGTCLRPNFSKEVAKESLIFGLKTMPSGVYGNILGFFSFLITFAYLPAYASWMGLFDLARMFSNQVNNPGTLRSSTEYSVSEAYNNEKYALSRYYISMALKWRFFLTGFFAVIIGIGIPFILREMLDLFGTYWLPALALIPLLSLIETNKIFEIPVSFTKLGRPVLDQIYAIIKTTVGFIWYLLLIWVIFPAYGLQLTMILWILKDLPLTILWRVVDWLLLHFLIIKIHPREFVMQAFVLPLPAIIIFGVFMYYFGAWFFPLGASVIGGIPMAAVSFVFALFVAPICVYTPLLSLFGAWDEKNQEFFERAIPLAGPSKIILKMMYKSAMFFYNFSPLKGRFVLQGAEDAAREALELEQQKFVKDRENKAPLSRQ